MSGRQVGDRQHQQGSHERGHDAHRGSVHGGHREVADPVGQLSAHPLALQRPHRPVAEHADRGEQADGDHTGDRGERRPAPATEADLEGAASAADLGPGPAPPDEALRGGHAQGQDPQDQGQGEGPLLVEEPVGEDLHRQGPVAHELDRPELAHGVEEHQQRPRPDGPAGLGQHHRPEDGTGPPTQQAGALLQRRGQGAEPGRHREVHVRLGEEDQHQPGAEPAVELDQLGDAEPLVDEATLGEGVDEGQRSHERREDEGQGDQHPPDAATGQVGAHREPRQRRAQEGGTGRHGHGEEHGSAQRRERLALAELGDEVGAGAQVAPDDVGERAEEQQGHDHRGDRQPEARPSLLHRPEAATRRPPTRSPLVTLRSGAEQHGRRSTTATPAERMRSNVTR